MRRFLTVGCLLAGLCAPLSSIAAAHADATGNNRLLANVVPTWRSLPAKGNWALQVGLGVNTGLRGSARAAANPDNPTEANRKLSRRTDASSVVSVMYGLTDRLSMGIPLPLLAYRFGEKGHFELIVRGGAPELGYSSISGLLGALDAGLTTRTWLNQELSLVSNGLARWQFGDGSRRRDLRLRASGGILWRAADRLRLAFGAEWSGGIRIGPDTFPVNQTSPTSEVAWGATQEMGYASLPLVSFSVLPYLSIDAYASWHFNLKSRNTVQRYLAGTTWAF